MIYSIWGRGLVFPGNIVSALFPHLLGCLCHEFQFCIILFVAARPKYRRNMSSDLKEHRSDDNNDQRSIRHGSSNHKLVSEQSRTLKRAIQQYKPVQVML